MPDSAPPVDVEDPAPPAASPASSVRKLGLAIAMDTVPSAHDLADAIADAAAEAGCQVLISDTRDDVDVEQAAVRELRARRIDGLLLVPTAGDHALINHLVRLRVPTVLVDRLARRGDVDQVGVENIQATSTLVRHLAEHGHRQIGLVSGADGTTTSDERALGYRLGVGRAGLRYDARLVAGSGFTAAGAAQATARLLDREDPPTALVVAGDPMLVGVQYEVHRRGMRLGVDLAVAGFGDPSWARHVDPPWTTMAVPVEEVGRQAVALLAARASDPRRPCETLRLPPAFVRRASCGCRAR